MRLFCLLDPYFLQYGLYGLYLLINLFFRKSSFKCQPILPFVLVQIRKRRTYGAVSATSISSAYSCESQKSLSLVRSPSSFYVSNIITGHMTCNSEIYRARLILNSFPFLQEKSFPNASKSSKFPPFYPSSIHPIKSSLPCISPPLSIRHLHLSGVLFHTI